MNIFDQLEGLFTPDEAWGDWKEVSGLLILLLYHVRKLVGVPIKIHCAYDKGDHVDNSHHYVGEAVDFHFENLPYPEAIKKLEQALETLHVSHRVGLGIYPEWAHPGFHLDVRGVIARWGQVRGKYISYAIARNAVMSKEA